MRTLPQNTHLNPIPTHDPVNKVLVPHNAFAKHATDMYIYSHTNTKHTPEYNTIHTHDAQTSRMRIF